MRMKKLHRLLLVAGTLITAGNAAGQQTFSVVKISEDANTRSDQRPIPIGFYDKTVNKTFVTWMGANSQTIIKTFDHTTHKWSEDKVVGKPTFIDKHNYPGMLR